MNKIVIVALLAFLAVASAGYTKKNTNRFVDTKAVLAELDKE